MAKLMVVSGAASAGPLDLDSKTTLSIGRDPSCDLVLNHPDVSRNHAQVTKTPQGYLLKDLGSTNGTKVGGQKVAEHLLAEGDQITFGPVVVQAQGMGGAPATRVSGATQVRSSAPVLVGADGRKVEINKPTFLVGREKSCDLVLPVESVSARHAELKPTPQGLLVKDLGSTNGTFVGGHKITEKLIKNGESVTFDTIKFTLNIAGAPMSTQVRPAGEPSPAEHRPAPPAAKSGGGMGMGIIAGLVALAVIGGGAWYFLAGPGKGAPEPAPVAQEAKPATKAETAAAPAATTDKAATQTAATTTQQAEAPGQHKIIERLVFNHVWSFQAQDKIFSSPAIGDINGDGVLDVVVGCNDSQLYTIDGKTGRKHWSWRTDAPVLSSPLLVDLTKDGVLDIVVGSDDGVVYALNGSGQKIWLAPEDAKPGPGNEFQSSAAATNLNKDNIPDLVIGSQNGQLYGLTGDRGWEIWKTGTIMKAGIFATPALADINGDGVDDALVGSLDNNFYCVNGQNGWKVWDFATKAPIKASAAIGDLDRDGRPEVVLASTDGTVYALHAADGVELWRFESGVALESSPTLADLNKDGVPDVLAATTGGKLIALEGRNGLRLWEFDMAGAKVISSPVVHDLNNDGVLDVILCDSNRLVHAVSGVTGWELANFTLNAGVVSTPALADINGDGLLDLVVGVEDNNLVVLTINVPVEKGKVVWPNFRRNQQRQG